MCRSSLRWWSTLYEVTESGWSYRQASAVRAVSQVFMSYYGFCVSILWLQLFQFFSNLLRIRTLLARSGLCFFCSLWCWCSIPTSTSWDGLMSGSWCMSCRLLVLRKNRVQPSIPIFGTYSISSSHSDLVGRSFPSPKCRLRVSVKYISDRFLYFISISYHWEMRFLFLSAGAMVLRHLTISEGNLLDNWSSTWFALRFVHFLVLSYGVSILPWMGLPLLNLRWANEQCSA